MFVYLMGLCKKINIGLYIITCYQPQKSSIGLKKMPQNQKELQNCRFKTMILIIELPFIYILKNGVKETQVDTT